MGPFAALNEFVFLQPARAEESVGLLDPRPNAKLGRSRPGRVLTRLGSDYEISIGPLTNHCGLSTAPFVRLSVLAGLHQFRHF